MCILSSSSSSFVHVSIVLSLASLVRYTPWMLTLWLKRCVEMVVVHFKADYHRIPNWISSCFCFFLVLFSPIYLADPNWFWVLNKNPAHPPLILFFKTLLQQSNMLYANPSNWGCYKKNITGVAVHFRAPYFCRKHIKTTMMVVKATMV